MFVSEIFVPLFIAKKYSVAVSIGKLNSLRLFVDFNCFKFPTLREAKLDDRTVLPVDLVSFFMSAW